MTTAQARLRDILREQVGPALRADGYRGSGQNFSRRVGPNWAAVNIQRDQYSTADEVKFTLNLGTASCAVRIDEGFDPDLPVPEVECQWRARIGTLLPGGTDVWWRVGAWMPSSETQALGARIAEYLVALALPRLDEMASDRAILATYLSGEPSRGMPPATMDVVGSILSRIGPRDRFERYLEVVDADVEMAVELYTLWDSVSHVAMGPRRIEKRLARVSSGKFSNWDLIELGQSKSEVTAILATVRPLLEHHSKYVRFAAAHALGSLRDQESHAGLVRLVLSDSAREVATYAAFAIAKLDSELSTELRVESRQAIHERRGRAVGSDRPALTWLSTKLDRAH